MVVVEHVELDVRTGGSPAFDRSRIDGRVEPSLKDLRRLRQASIECVAAAAAYDEAKDVLFFSDRPDSWLSLPAGRFAIFFPDDAHAPLGGRGTLTKAIVKIAID